MRKEAEFDIARGLIILILCVAIIDVALMIIAVLRGGNCENISDIVKRGDCIGAKTIRGIQTLMSQNKFACDEKSGEVNITACRIEEASWRGNQSYCSGVTSDEKIQIIAGGGGDSDRVIEVSLKDYCWWNFAHLTRDCSNITGIEIRQECTNAFGEMR